MKKVIFSVVVIALLVSGAAIFFMNFDIVKNNKNNKTKNNVVKICNYEDIKKMNSATAALDISKISTLYNEIRSRDKYDGDVDCIALLALAYTYSDDSELSHYINILKKKVDQGSNPSLKIDGVYNLYRYNPEKIKSKGGE